jgi:hypothetical protein
MSVSSNSVYIFKEPHKNTEFAPLLLTDEKATRYTSQAEENK